jgi:hypothetical protein
MNLPSPANSWESLAFSLIVWAAVTVYPQALPPVELTPEGPMYWMNTELCETDQDIFNQ